MSVAFAVTIPTQPVTGALVYIPLGGDGFSAPQSAWGIVASTLAGDVSGGQAGMDVTLDDRYTSLVSFVAPQVNMGTEADLEVQMRLVGNTTPNMVENITLVAAAITSDAAGLWIPPAWICPGGDQVCTVSFVAPNTDGDTLVLSLLVYNFDIRAREVTPSGILNFARGQFG